MVLSGQHAGGLQLLREVAALPDASPDTRQVLAFAYAIAGDMAAAGGIGVCYFHFEDYYKG